MQMNFAGKNIELTSALRNFTTEKMQRLLTRFQNISQVHVTFEVEKLVQIAEATVHLDRTDIHARSESSDMYLAIDELVDKLLTQITKHKEKIRDHR